jgi:hypothetical protein
LPQEEREANLQVLTVYDQLSKADARILDEEMDISDCIKWCFDEGEGKGAFEVQLLGARCAIKAGLEDLVRDILLDSQVVDFVKVETLNALAEKNEGKTYGVVICNLYKRITIPKLEVDKLKHKVFLNAYSNLVSHFGVLDADYVYLLNAATHNFYYKLAEEGRLAECKDSSTLAAVIYKKSGIKESGLKDEEICSFFGANVNSYKRLLEDN